MSIDVHVGAPRPIAITSMLSETAIVLFELLGAAASTSSVAAFDDLVRQPERHMAPATGSFGGDVGCEYRSLTIVEWSSGGAAWGQVTGGYPFSGPYKDRWECGVEFTAFRDPASVVLSMAAAAAVARLGNVPVGEVGVPGLPDADTYIRGLAHPTASGSFADGAKQLLRQLDDWRDWSPLSD